MDFAATYYVNGSQFTPTRKRQYEAGWEPDYVNANTFDAAFIKAKAIYLTNHQDIRGSKPTHILLIKKEGPKREFRTVEWDNIG